MSTRVVCDASALTALLIDGGPDGTWATAALTDAELAAPHMIAFETANIIRRHELTGLISSDQWGLRGQARCLAACRSPREGGGSPRSVERSDPPVGGRTLPPRQRTVALAATSAADGPRAGPASW